jgi:hypothetical protein
LSPYADRYKYDPMEMSDVAAELATPPEKESTRKKKKKSKRRSESPKKSKSQRRKSESGSKGESQHKPPRKEKRKERPDPAAGKQAKQQRRSRTLRTGTGKQAWEEDAALTEGDPAFFWNLAMTNKYMYNSSPKGGGERARSCRRSVPVAEFPGGKDLAHLLILPGGSRTVSGMTSARNGRSRCNGCSARGQR